MWSRISNVLKPRHTHEESEPSSSQGVVMSRTVQQHPNPSVSHVAFDPHTHPPSPPGSPSKNGRRGIFRRMSRGPVRDEDLLRAPSPMTLPLGLPKKIKSSLSLRLTGNNSQTSLLCGTSDTGRLSPDNPPSSSKDLPRPPVDRSEGQGASTMRSQGTFRRPSLDMLRSQDGPEFIPSPTENLLEEGRGRAPITPSVDAGLGSVHSILRDRDTPGTGQNVRFFSRNAYKVISPDHSMDTEFQSALSKNQVQNLEAPFLERTSPESASPSARRKAPRPTVAEVFSPLINEATSPVPQDQKESVSSRLATPIPAPDFLNNLDLSGHVDLPATPPGLGFDVEEPTLDSSMDLDDDGQEDRLAGHNKFTSTPYRDKAKGKAKAMSLEDEKENVPVSLDEPVSHVNEKPPRIPSVFHDRSHSFSFGQTVFHSITNSSASPPGSSIGFSSAALKPSLLDKDTDSLGRASSVRGRGRAMSDTVFQSMMRLAPKHPEADVDNDTSQALVFDSRGGTGTSEPDPFSANARTYYTPQTMIPTTPPQGFSHHMRKTSKEENIIFSLQTQLAFQTELCQQYEIDLRAREEQVGILDKRLADFEKDEVNRRTALRTWKKKVQELEKTCRYLEEEVEGSRHESMERSVMDEASGEALRMLHRQIAVLEKEKKEWGRKEEVLREEVETLEGLMKARSDDIMDLKEKLWNRDESQQKLQDGIREAKEQMEMMGNVSVGFMDEEELKRLVAENQQKNEEEKERHLVAESMWEDERTEFLAKVGHLEAEKATLEQHLVDITEQLQTRDNEYGVLKIELEAQWTQTEKATGRIESLEARLLEAEKERDTIKHDLEELEQKTSNMEVEWTESENKKAELESKVQEVWHYKEGIEKERERLQNELQKERDHSDSLTGALQEQEDCATSDRQLAVDNVSRLEEKLRQRDRELAEYSDRIAQHEAEAEHLLEEMTNLKREYSLAADEQSRAQHDVSLREGEARSEMEALIRQKAEKDVEIETLTDKVVALKDEVERLRRQVHELQQESADKEVKIVQLTKQRAQDKEDLQGINIALDSKQQELELLKRKIGVRGTAGSTPAHPSRVTRQRGSSINTPIPRPSSRPSSAMSNASSSTTNRKSIESLSASAKISALGKSVRENGATPGAASAPLTTSKSSARAVEGSMGPPPAKPRASAGVTPTPLGRVSSYSRFPVTTKSAVIPPGTPVPRRHISSLEKAQSKTKLSKQAINGSSVSEHDEKENISVGSKRRSLLQTPA